MADTERKQAEIEYPQAIGEEGRAWLRSKPFGNTPRESARLLIDFAYILELLDLRPGVTMVELGCGSGWMTRFATRHGIRAEGYDISPDMIAIARELAEQEGLDRLFKEAGFEWREAGCSMCLAMNADVLQPGERCASTSNRNFEGRQGAGGRTHLVSPAMAVAAAIEGHFVDIRHWA